MSSLVCYSSEQIEQVWPQVRVHIKRGLDQGSEYSIHEIYEGLCSKTMQLWTWRDEDIHSALVTAIQTRKAVTFCLLLAVGGSRMDEWAKYLPLVEDWAKDQGATEMRIYGRIGWAKVLNYDVEYCKLRKGL